MKLGEGEQELVRYTARGFPRGREWVLTSRRVICTEPGVESSLALSYLTSVAASFRRRRGEIASGILILLFAVLFGQLFSWAQSNMPQVVESLISLVTGENDSPENIETARRMLLARAESLLTLFPIAWAVLTASVLYAAWLIFEGLRGQTILTASYLSGESEMKVKGRDKALMEFGEKLAQRLQ